MGITLASQYLMCNDQLCVDALSQIFYTRMNNNQLFNHCLPLVIPFLAENEREDERDLEVRIRYNGYKGMAKKHEKARKREYLLWRRELRCLTKGSYLFISRLCRIIIKSKSDSNALISIWSHLQPVINEEIRYDGVSIRSSIPFGEVLREASKNNVTFNELYSKIDDHPRNRFKSAGLITESFSLYDRINIAIGGEIDLEGPLIDHLSKYKGQYRKIQYRKINYPCRVLMNAILGPQVEELDLDVECGEGLLDLRSCHKLKKLKIRFKQDEYQEGIPLEIRVREREAMTLQDAGCQCLYPDLNKFDYDSCDAYRAGICNDDMIRNLIPNCSFHHMKRIFIGGFACLTRMKLSIPVDYVKIDTDDHFDLVIEEEVKSLLILNAQLNHNTYINDDVVIEELITDDIPSLKFKFLSGLISLSMTPSLGEPDVESINRLLEITTNLKYLELVRRHRNVLDKPSRDNIVIPEALRLPSLRLYGIKAKVYLPQCPIQLTVDNSTFPFFDELQSDSQDVSSSITLVNMMKDGHLEDLQRRLLEELHHLHVIDDFEYEEH